MVVIDALMSDIFMDNDFNCRGAITPADVVDLALSIKEIGLQQPIVLQPWDKNGKKYRIISGHRRFIAHKINSATTIKAIVNSDLMDEMKARLLNLEENIKRKQLNMLQEASAIKPFIAAGWSQKEIATRLNQPVPWVHIRVQLLRLPEEVQQEAAAGILTQEHIRQISTMKGDTNKIFEAVKKVKEAKFRGDKRQIMLVKPKNKPLSKRKRDRTEIFEMINHLRETVGLSLTTRCLAWAAGEVTDFEIYGEIKKLMLEQGKEYQIPNHVMENTI